MLTTVTTYDTTAWDPATDPFFLEFFGETAPAVDTAYAEVLQAGAVPFGAGQITDTSAPTELPSSVNQTPVYEYWWTLGHSGGAIPIHSRHRLQLREGRPNEWEDLDDVAAHVYVYFPTSGRWRIKEIIATVQFLTPLQQEHPTWQRISDDIANLSPLINNAASLATLMPQGNAVGGILSAITRLSIASVPQTIVPWTVEKVTCLTRDGNDHAPYQGLAWTLPSSAFEILGSRITGSIAVSLVPAVRQGDPDVKADTKYSTELFLPRDILCTAVVHPRGARSRGLTPAYDGGSPISLVAEQAGFLRLTLHPQVPLAPTGPTA